MGYSSMNQTNLPPKMTLWTLIKFWVLSKHNLLYSRESTTKYVSLNQIMKYKGKYYTLSIKEHKD